MGLVMIDGWWLKGGWTDFDLDIAAKATSNRNSEPFEARGQSVQLPLRVQLVVGLATTSSVVA
jgi:hypothetical protein